MIIPKKSKLNNDELKLLRSIVEEFNCKVGEVRGETKTVYPIIGDETSQLLFNRVEGLEFIDHVARIQVPYKLMHIENKLGNSHIKIGDVEIGKTFKVIAGQCTIDPKNPNYFLETAHAVKEAGADILRGGVWKPRTNPHSFQGDEKSLTILMEAKRQTGLPVDTEVMDESQIDIVLDAGVQMLQVGARNALNYGLLKIIGRKIKDKPDVGVLLKRSIHMGPADEFISAAEYIVSGGNSNVCLCPRGTIPKVEGFRNNPDESITLLLKQKTWAPIIVDPSHAMGKPEFVPKACLAAASYGADGVCVETHIDPKRGIGDDPRQSITPKVLKQVIEDCKEIASMSEKYRVY